MLPGEKCRGRLHPVPPPLSGSSAILQSPSGDNRFKPGLGGVHGGGYGYRKVGFGGVHGGGYGVVSASILGRLESIGIHGLPPN